MKSLEFPKRRPIERTQAHRLGDIVGLAICGGLCGADGWTDIEEFGVAKEAWLRKFLALPNGMPSHDTIGRVVARMLPGEFQQRFQRWIPAIATQTKGQVVAIDGKTLRHSADRGRAKAAMHSGHVEARIFLLTPGATLQSVARGGYQHGDGHVRQLSLSLFPYSRLHDA